MHFIDPRNRFKKVEAPLGTMTAISRSRLAERLCSVTRVDDVVARLGGDEFVVVQTRVGSKDRVEDFAGRLISAVTAPMKFREQSIVATVSVGVALAAESRGNDPERLLKKCRSGVIKRPKPTVVIASGSSCPGDGRRVAGAIQVKNG